MMTMMIAMLTAMETSTAAVRSGVISERYDIINEKEIVITGTAAQQDLFLNEDNRCGFVARRFRCRTTRVLDVVVLDGT